MKNQLKATVTFVNDRSASIAPITVGLLLTPLLGLVALAVDFSGVVAARTKLALAADSAVLSATQTAVQTFAKDPDDWNPSEAAAAGKYRFTAQVGGMAGTSVQAPVVAVGLDGTTFTGRITYKATYNTAIAGLLGFATIPMSGSATAVVKSRAFVDIYMLMDTSESMLIAATDNDIHNMQVYTSNSDGGHPNTDENTDPYTKSILQQWNQDVYFAYPAREWGWTTAQGVGGEPGCAFACHWIQGNDEATFTDNGGDLWSDHSANLGIDWIGQYDFYRISRDKNVTLRLDQIKLASISLANKVASANFGNQYRLALSTFAIATVDQVPLTSASNNSTVVQGIRQTKPPITGNGTGYFWIDPGNPGAAQTYIDDTLVSFATRFNDYSNDGTSQNSASKFVVLMTDGVNDTATNPWGGRAYGPVGQAACNAIKNKNVTLAILHTVVTTALNPVGGANGLTGDQVVSNALQSCASSSDLYFAVTSQDEINAAMTKITSAAISTPAHFTE